MFNSALASFAFFAVARSQQVGTITPETHPTLPWWQCLNGVGCNSVIFAPVVLDSNWRWIHNVGGTTNCYTGNTWDTNLCPDGKTCAANCALEGADYAGTFGITTSSINGGSITQKFVTSGAQKNIGSRVYLMLEDTHYQIFKPLNQEFTFDVDVSNLPCGVSASLTFTQMDADGGMAKYSTNKAGAKYGTGYCDSKCPKDLKFINGEANSVGWTPSTNDATTGTGNYGSCCNEMNIWEANSVSAAYTAHAGCIYSGQYRCEGYQCDSSETCFPDGCEFNSYRMGNKTFYGKELTVDTSRPFTVVTQFFSDDNTKTGTLVEIRRLYIQDGKVIANSKVNIPGISGYDSITDQYCDDKENILWDNYSSGRLSDTGKWFTNGAVLAMSIQDDHATNMLWLDSAYPTTANPAQPGVARGSCSTTSGKPSDIEASDPNASVTFSYIRFGDICSTFNGTGSDCKSTVKPTCTGTSTAPGPTQTKFGQCGGIGYSGPTLCACGSACTKTNDYYSQCV